MRFQVLSHAGLLVESGGASLVVDPWLVGSCYWRSWWNLPEPPRDVARGLRPSAIYVTHLHWDHFHGPSLRRFDRDTRMLVPKIPTRRMVDDLLSLGFTDIVEIPHGATVLVGPLRLTSYQFGPVAPDSALVVSDDRTTLLDANDCKIFGLPLRQLRRAHPHVDFCLRSHSSATCLPQCVADYPRRFAEQRTADDYIEEFARACLAVGARHAVPFASNHCFLHPETRRFNAGIVSPTQVAAAYARIAAEAGSDSRCVVMPPGSSFDDDRGFDLVPFDDSRRDEHVAALAERHRSKLEAQVALERKAAPSWPAFERYFGRLLAVLPGFGLSRRLPHVKFRLRWDGGEEWWLVDLPGRAVRRSGPDDTADVTIESVAHVINDCVRKRLFSTWGASKRLTLHVPGDDLRPVLRFLLLLDAFEHDLLPLANALSRRHLGVRLRRWREAVAMLEYAVRSRRAGFRIADLYPIGDRARRPLEGAGQVGGLRR